MRSWFYGKRPLALALTVVVLHAPPTGCASRVVPGRYPPSSAAAADAPQARPAVVDAALTTDPPLPGQAATAWPGLFAEPAADPPTRHGGHHGR